MAQEADHRGQKRARPDKLGGNLLRQQIRRTSSLHLPVQKHPHSILHPPSSVRHAPPAPSPGVLLSALSNIKSSTLSLSAASAFGRWPSSTRYAVDVATSSFTTGAAEDSEPINLYTLMARYRCCCGLCRLRVGSFTIALVSIVCSMMVIAALTIESRSTALASIARNSVFSVSLIVLMSYQLFASILFLTALFIDVHYLVLPYQASCILNMMGSMAVGLVLLVSTDRSNTHYFPAFALLSTALVAVYLWFLVICSMTFVLIRDKRRLMASELEFGDTCEDENGEGHLDRVNSAEF